MNNDGLSGEWSRDQSPQQFNQYNPYGQSYPNSGMTQSYATDPSLAQAMSMGNAGYGQPPVNLASNPVQPRTRTVIKRKKSDSFMGMVVLFAMSVVAVVFMGLFVWAYINWDDLKTSTDKKISDQVETMRRQVKQEMSVEFEKREKEPNRTFSGPVDYGELSFAYPKTWSSYVAKEAANGGDFEAYFKPGVVPPVSDKGIFALRVKIVSRPFDKMVDSYRQDKKLKLSTRTVNGKSTNYYEGTNSDGLKIRMVLIKIRDKTAVIRTDAEVYKDDFEKILKTIKFKE